MADALANARRELEHAVSRAEAELGRLRRALEALTHLDGTSPEPRRRARRTAPAGNGRRRRRGGSRADQAQKLVQSHPGITIPELAKSMKIQPNYLYRVLPTLEKDGKIKRDGKGWKPA